MCRSRGVLIMVLLLCNSATKTAGWKSSYAFPDSYKFDHNETVEMEISELEDKVGSMEPSSKDSSLDSRKAIRMTPPGAYRDSTFRKPKAPPAATDCHPAKVPKGTDRCKYVKNEPACWHQRQEAALFDYNTVYYCYADGNPLMLVPLTLWLLLIFYTLAVAADAFFCPAVDVISDALKLPPDVAGATLLSFGNGAPDVFTQVAAITHGAQPDVLLALSSVLGSGLFITTVVLACVLLAAPQPVVLDWTFRRDTLAYLVSVLLILAVMLDGKVELWQSSLLFIYYTGYLCMVIFFGTNTGDVDEDEEDVPYSHAGKVVREFGIHPTSAWLRDVVQWEQKSRLEKLCSPATVPVLVIMNLTMTADPQPGRVYGGVLAVCAPIFFLMSLGVEPGEHSSFFFIFFSMVVLSAAMYATSSVELVTGKWLVPTVTFVQSILWMKLCAGTLVELLEVMGGVMGLSPAFLGATVLAWGSSVADLAANAAIARKQPKMAVSACLAGPLFNLLAGMSSSLIYQNMLYGDVKVNLDNAVLLIVGATAVLMLYMGIAVPTIHKYHLSRNWIAALVVMYVVFTGLYLANQMGLLFVSPWITPGMFPTQV